MDDADDASQAPAPTSSLIESLADIPQIAQLDFIEEDLLLLMSTAANAMAAATAVDADKADEIAQHSAVYFALLERIRTALLFAEAAAASAPALPPTLTGGNTALGSWLQADVAMARAENTLAGLAKVRADMEKILAGAGAGAGAGVVASDKD